MNNNKLSKDKYYYNKIKLYSFIIEYVSLAFMSILIINKFNPKMVDFNIYIPWLLDIVIILVYIVVLYLFSGKEQEPSTVELIIRFGYLLIIAHLMAEINTPSVELIIVLPTIVMAVRYKKLYTVIMAGMTTIVILVSDIISKGFASDYKLILICFIWLIGLLINSSLEIQRQMQEERKVIQETEKLTALGKMAAGIVHEIRNPLTTIKGFVQLMYRCQDSEMQEEKSKKYLRMIDKEIDRTSSLLEEILKYVKPSEPQLQLNDVNKTLTDIKFILEAHSVSKGIKMNVNLIPDLPKIKCDYNQIKQVIINIVLNAVEAMSNSEKKILNIRTYFDKQYVYIRIEDSGTGIGKSQIKDIFNPFFTTKENGTGIGLSICNSIVKNHNGKIKVTSEINKGTEFTIFLPKEQNDITGIMTNLL